LSKTLPVRRPLKTQPLHPGTLLREDVLPGLNVKVSQTAVELGVSRQLLHRILAAAASVTPEMAVRLGQWVGNGPDLWLTLQQQYDLWHAQRELADAVKQIPRRAVA
jgi:antitoxin HigA-1